MNAEPTVRLRICWVSRKTAPRLTDKRTRPAHSPIKRGLMLGPPLKNAALLPVGKLMGADAGEVEIRPSEKARFGHQTNVGKTTARHARQARIEIAIVAGALRGDWNDGADFVAIEKAERAGQGERRLLTDERTAAVHANQAQRLIGA